MVDSLKPCLKYWLWALRYYAGRGVLFDAGGLSDGDYPQS